VVQHDLAFGTIHCRQAATLIWGRALQVHSRWNAGFRLSHREQHRFENLVPGNSLECPSATSLIGLLQRQHSLAPATPAGLAMNEKSVTSHLFNQSVEALVHPVDLPPN
jgi:hypothetical protein